MKSFIIWTTSAGVLIRSAESLSQAAKAAREEGYKISNIQPK